MEKIWIGVICIIAAVCAGCTIATEPAAEYVIEDLAPYATYKDPAPLEVHWQTIQACSGLTGDFNAVTFYTAKSITKNGRSLGGVFFPAGNRIVLAQGIFSPQNEAELIQHEEMHALYGSGGHPEEFFNGRCGNLMLYSE